MVRHKLGYGQMPVSYLKFIFDKATGMESDAGIVNLVAFAAFSIAAGISLVLNAGRLRAKNA